MKHIIAFIILLSISISAFAQSEKEWLFAGDAAFNNKEYDSAINFYLKVIGFQTAQDKNNLYPYEIKFYSNSSTKEVPGTKEYAIHQIAESYRLNHNYKNAELWFQKSVATNFVLYPNESYWYGDALMKNEKYQEAVQQFEKTIITASEKKDLLILKQAKCKLEGCRQALDTGNIKQGTVITALDSSLNSGSSSFSANYYGNTGTIQFAAARDENILATNCDIYTIRKTLKGWTGLKKIDGAVNTLAHEAAGCLESDRSKYFFTRWSVTNKDNCAIYLLKQMSGRALVEQKMNEHVNLEGYMSMQPNLSSDGGTLYFSSNRPGGYGKMDIWYVNLDEEGKPRGPATNMGAIINTAEDEVSPFLHTTTSTLYFSSDGLPGFGGLDVFKTTFTTDSAWSKPKNVGAPINSGKEDAYFVLEQNQRQGFLSSDRKGCSDCPGACYKIYSIDKEPNQYDLQGTVYNSDNNQVIARALISIKDIHGNKEPFYLVTDSLGHYSTSVEEGMDVYIKAQKNYFFADATSISTMRSSESEHFIKDLFLSPIPSGDIVVLGIEYDNNESLLRTESKIILNELADFLKLNNNLSIELSSHTDERGNTDYNIKLSQERAKACVEYLVSKGVASERLIAIGYGSTQPVILNAQTEEEHQKNRRTAFRPFKEAEIKVK